MDYLITICIVNYNSSEFVLNTLYCLEKITKNNYKVIIRDNNSKLKDYLNFKNTRSFKDGPFHNLVAVGEYYLDEIFASHFGRGSYLGWAKYFKEWKKKLYSIPIIGAYIINLKGRREKKKWIKICKKIVNNID